MKNFVQVLVDAMPSPHARMACVSVLARYEGCMVYVPTSSKAERRKRAALHMLNGREMMPNDIVNALRERFRISERTAWRDVEHAKAMQSDCQTE